MNPRETLPDKTTALLAHHRETLLQAEFREAAAVPLRFYRPDTKWTAFAVNLLGDASGVTGLCLNRLHPHGRG